VAWDKTSGRELGSADLPGTAIGTPMTYQVNGRQYIALTVLGPTRDAVPGWWRSRAVGSRVPAPSRE
jgi:glucose dehydrogenase